MGKGSKQVKQFIQQQQQQPQTAAQQAFDRKYTIKRLTAQLGNLKREIDFKATQTSNGKIIETRSVNRLPDGTSTIVDGYIDNLKPKHILLNEIDELLVRCEMWQEQIDELKRIEAEENARKTSSE